MSADCVGTGCKAESLLKCIAELEAKANTFESAAAELLAESAEDARNKLAALLKKIEDAPVVAWEDWSDEGQEWNLTRHANKFANQQALIRKEDLTK